MSGKGGAGIGLAAAGGCLILSLVVGFIIFTATAADRRVEAGADGLGAAYAGVALFGASVVIADAAFTLSGAVCAAAFMIGKRPRAAVVGVIQTFLGAAALVVTLAVING